MINRPITLAILLFFPLAACSERDLRWTGTMYDSAGVTIVSNTDVGIWAPGEEWTLEEEVRIGAVEGLPEYLFGSIGGIAVDSKGGIFVLDDHAQHIQVYSPDGVFQHTVGARGEGPGELQLAWSPLVGPGDTLLVPDGRLQRFNRYAPDGSSIGSFRWEFQPGRTIAFKTTTSGVIAEQIGPLWTPLESTAEVDDLTDVIVLRELDGGLTDTLLTFPSGELMGPSGVRVFASEAKWALADDQRLAFGASDEYRIHLYAGGHLERIITKPFERKSVDDREREAILGEMERRWAEASISEDVKARLRSRWNFADYYPAFQNLEFGPRGTIWVQRVKFASELSEADFRHFQNARSPEWEVFDSEGRFLGVVTMPQRFRPSEFRGEKIYGVLHGDFDESYVVRLRVIGDSGAGAT
jgi:hypothetical protein